MREIAIPLPVGRVSASVHGEGSTFVVLGHGAGGTRRTPALVALAEALAVSGRTALLFNFPYSEAGRRLPDRTAVLEGTVRAVAQHARSLGAQRLVLGGRSMGGRMASQVVAAGERADALLLLAYPLHPPGQPEKRREAHFAALRAPMLFVHGTRDAFARADLFQALLDRLGARASVVHIEGGDHGFAVPRRSGRSAPQVEAHVQAEVVRWLVQLGL